MRKRKLVRVIIGCFLALWIVGLQNSKNTVMAADNGTLLLENLEVNDLVEVYRIASYAEATGKYNWATAASNWMQNTTEGNMFQSLTPERLSQMTEERAEEFCELLLLGLKNDSEGIANIPGYSFTVEEEKEQYNLEVAPGYYIILPKGTERIYRLKWLVVEPKAEQTVTYLAEQQDYLIPELTFSVSNLTENRGVNNDTDNYPFTLEGDEMEMIADIQIPKYPNMYSSGKRILNICIAVPGGLSYQEDSLTITDGAANLEEEAYSLQQLTNSIAYETQSGELLFVGTINGYFYLPNGSLLLSAGTEQEALDKYNVSYGTEYRLDTENLASSASEEGEELSTEENSSEEMATEESVPTDNLAVEDAGLTLERATRMTVFIVALDTGAEISTLHISYHATKNNAGTDTGFFTNRLLLSYSTSALDSDLNCVAERTATVVAYGIRITVCRGDGKSVGMTAEEILKEAPRMKGASFFLYQLTNIYEGDTSAVQESSTETEETTTEENAVPPQLIYKKDEDKTYEFSYVTQLNVNENGVTEISGLPQQEYLVVQTEYPEGYTRSEEAIWISSADWKDDTVMEGNYLLDVLWLDYATVYLPGTGKTGILFFVIVGTLIAGIAAFAIVKRTYPGGIKSAYVVCFYVIKLKIKYFLKKFEQKNRKL